MKFSPTMYKGSFFSTLPPTVAIFHLFDNKHSAGGRWYLTVVLVHIFLMISDVVVFFFLVVQVFELRSSYLLGRSSVPWATPPALLALVIFQMRFCIFALGLASHYDSPSSHHARLIGWVGASLLPQLASNHDPFYLCLSSSRCEPQCPAVSSFKKIFGSLKKVYSFSCY
jgi:hypothetical protein